MSSLSDAASLLRPQLLRPELDILLPQEPIPKPLTRLVGRERELAAVRALLNRPEARLVTLTGPGGVGKTRIALALATNALARFADGAVFVPLASVRDPALVLPTVARALGLREAGDQPLDERLHRFLACKAVLLVLDNFEQVLAAAPDIAVLLTSCSDLVVLATSRAPLHVSGERTVRIAPLPLPTLSHPTDIASSAAELMRSDAVRLFVERAQEMSADFMLTDANAGAVMTICRQLDGLPLAIELAAARVKILPPTALQLRLERRLPLLTGGPRDAPQRQRTMRDAIQWSYDLLGADEQALFRGLSIFVGGFTLDAAAAVSRRVASSPPGPTSEADDAEDEEIALLDGVSTLIGASLLAGNDISGDDPRYVMLETVREFGLEMLAVSSEAERTRQAHAEYFLAFAEQAAPALIGPGQRVWLDRLEAEQANLRVALHWLREQDDAERSLRLGAALYDFWFRRSLLGEGRAQLEAILALPGAQEATAGRARVLDGACELADWQGDLVAATTFGEEALAIWRRLGDTRGMATSLINLSNVAIRAEDYPRAERLWRESLARFREAGDRWGEAMALGRLPIIAYGRGEVAEAAGGLNAALAPAREVGDPFLLATVLAGLGHVLTRLRQYERAWAAYVESIALQQTIRDPWRLAWCLAGMGWIAMAGGQHEQAARLLGAATAMRESTGGPLRSFIQQDFDHIVGEVRAALESDAFAVAWAAGQALTDEQAIAEALAVTSPSSTMVPAPPVPTSKAEAFGFTPREMDVLRLLREGRSDKEIGAALFISPRTVMSHVSRILSKLGVATRGAAAHEATSRGLI